MAFKNAKVVLTDTAQTAYTCPASTEAVVLLCQAANVDGTSDSEITVGWTDASDGDAETSLALEIAVPAQASIGLIDGKLVLEAGDTIKAKADADDMLHLSISVMELET